MVRIQSSWFPLHDRDPQIFVPDIFLAGPSDYKKVTQRIHRSPRRATYIGLPVVDAAH
jgi:predicted acyl esterase